LLGEVVHRHGDAIGIVAGDLDIIRADDRRVVVIFN